jgi:AraC-like DNA-binding protein
MHENLNLTFLAGGRNHCTPAWNRKAGREDICFKIYYITKGGATLVSSKESVDIQDGYIHIIDGNRLTEMRCAGSMDVFWLHFEPESLFIEQVLSALPPVISIPASDIRYKRTDWYEIIKIFDISSLPADRTDHSLFSFCSLQSLAMAVLSVAFKNHSPADDTKKLNELYRFKDVVLFMDTHYHLNPPLEELASKMGMAPEYFHRQFKKLFTTTPHEYMFKRRISKARNLLKKTNLQIQEIAQECGYDNPFYFSRIFTKQLGISPTEYRKRDYLI